MKSFQIDPLNDEWQVIFKNSYHVLKQVVDQNIWRLKQLKLLPLASQAAAAEDYNREPPPDIDWPADEEAKFTWFHSEMLKLNKDGARVLLKGKITCLTSISHLLTDGLRSKASH